MQTGFEIRAAWLNHMRIALAITRIDTQLSFMLQGFTMAYAAPEVEELVLQPAFELQCFL